MKTSYSNYKDFYKTFSTNKGYYKACDYLSFQNDRWRKIGKYLNSIEMAIIDTKKRIRKNKLLMADIGCGAYGWLPRYFSKHASKIICIDLNKDALKEINRLSNPIVTTIRDDAFALKNIFAKDYQFDFIYCGFNVYAGFIENFLKLTSPGGCIFLMKPKLGDDLNLRALIKGYDISKRYKEIERISSILEKSSKVKYYEKIFSWKFVNVNLDKLIAALSIVCLGKPKLLRPSQYKVAIDFLRLKKRSKVIILSQTFSLWEAIKY